MNNKERIQKIISEPTYGNNIRKKIKDAIALMNFKQQGYILIDYVKHSLVISHNITESDEDILDSLILMLDGVLTPEEIKDRGSLTIFIAHDDISLEEVEKKKKLLMQLLTRFCFAIATPEIKHHKSVFRTASYLPDDIFKYLSQYYGGKNWNSQDVEKRNEARKKGYEVAKIECRWQLNMITQFINTHHFM